ncbi:MAG: guanylate kinase [Lachnospiraceae bacterium]|nr:guanylate kinase [Lachnospiraceae bacterium]
MSKIFYIIGKSATGKDTIYRNLLKKYPDRLKNVVMYTTRPMRDGEADGVTYNYVDEAGYLKLKESGDIIEERAYDTVHGIWRYFTVYDSQIDLKNNNYVILGVLDSYTATMDYFGKDTVIPIYIEVEDGERLTRALKREKKPGNHKYAEMCRRFLADTDDFSEEKLKAAGIDIRFENIDLNACLRRIEDFILKEIEDDQDTGR